MPSVGLISATHQQARPEPAWVRIFHITIAKGALWGAFYDDGFVQDDSASPRPRAVAYQRYPSRSTSGFDDVKWWVVRDDSLRSPLRAVAVNGSVVSLRWVSTRTCGGFESSISRAKKRL
ncbi:hypothetical protein KCP77_18470 [Salmonella enterica subsp. enterica]|nr:hypothetical protein KCP77_18470 [Salmonella enterica subsp. enterica]